MAVGDTLQGRRIPDQDELQITEPGDYQLRDGGKILWCVLPSGEHGRVDERWRIEEHEDGTISVGPLTPGGSHSIQTPGWHGFLEHGVWREV